MKVIIIALSDESRLEFRNYWNLKEIQSIISSDDYSTTVKALSPAWIRALNKDRVDFYENEQ